MAQPPSQTGPPDSELATLGKRQQELAEMQYHRLLAAVQHKYRIDNHPSGPHHLHKVSFEAYTDRSLEPTEAAVDPRDNLPEYIQGLHKMFRSNPKTLEGDILYSIVEPQCWPFIEYYHSPAKTTGRDDWDSMFATLRTTPRRSVVPCMFVSTPLGCHISDCPFYHPPPSDIAASRSSLLEARRIYLMTPTQRNRYTYARNHLTGDSGNRESLMAEADTLAAICDNGLCAKKARPDGGNLLICSGCGWARYCSVDCQKRCRKRHKMICIQVDLLIEDDDMWTMEGHLKGLPSLRSELDQGLFGTRA
ncbi:hypothetical protein HYFRA_00012108 [Hymenoscyphus fraxineus]|uniref:MYND-type domain-containing protein n=1 Tax=Hymenoscyphus fraxineus TaxID=746836 RepID=A0A9N9L043_9HELO|nr:hypothetical protein HYFRA_00012108 [Hymenoscyphus fraxineus]